MARGIEAAPLAVSGVADLADAYVSTTDLDYWREIGTRDRWLALTEATWESRAFGDFHHHMLVAEGLMDAAVEPGASAWDLAAPAVVVQPWTRESRGCCFDGEVAGDGHPDQG